MPDSLKQAFPVLFSFARNPDCSVQSQFIEGNWHVHLHPNLSQTATQDLQLLHQLVDQVNLDFSSLDAWVPMLGGNSLCTSYFYKLLTFWGVLWAPAFWIWDNIIPLKSRIFLWLAFWGRLNTKANMLHKGWSAVAPTASCDACPAEETADHLLLRRRPADALWSRLSLAPLA